MTSQILNKDQTITDFLAMLGERFGKDSFDIVDHWDGDLLAVGIARRDNHKVLAYVSTCGLPDGGYYIELEMPPKIDDDLPFQCVGRQEGIDFEKAATLIAEHLTLKESYTE